MGEEKGKTGWERKGQWGKAKERNVREGLGGEIGTGVIVY